MKRRLVAFATLLVLVTSVLGTGSASALSAKLDFHVADALIGGGTGIPQLGARAVADNGDIVSVVGAGTFNLGSGKTTGGGTFVHTTSGGVLVGSGTWTATGVEDFTFYGCGGDLPSDFCGGVLSLDVHLVAGGGAAEFNGALTIDCLIGDFPATAIEGIKLNVSGGPNFDETMFEPSGLTLYLSRSKNG